MLFWILRQVKKGSDNFVIKNIMKQAEKETNTEDKPPL